MHNGKNKYAMAAPPPIQAETLTMRAGTTTQIKMYQPTKRLLRRYSSVLRYWRRHSTSSWCATWRSYGVGSRLGNSAFLATTTREATQSTSLTFTSTGYQRLLSESKKGKEMSTVGVLGTASWDCTLLAVILGPSALYQRLAPHCPRVAPEAARKFHPTAAGRADVRHAFEVCHRALLDSDSNYKLPRSA